MQIKDYVVCHFCAPNKTYFESITVQSYGKQHSYLPLSCEKQLSHFAISESLFQAEEYMEGFNFQACKIDTAHCLLIIFANSPGSKLEGLLKILGIKFAKLKLQVMMRNDGAVHNVIS